MMNGKKMATNTDEDPDLESLRSAVLASLKTKSVTASKSEAEESPTEITVEERSKEEKKNDMVEEDEEEDLHALRLAALKTKRDDGLPKEPKTAPTTFARQGNLISIQIVDPEEEKRKAEAERIAKAKALAAAKAEVSKAAKPARFRRVESSDSENEEDEEEEEEEELQKEEENRSGPEGSSDDEKSVSSDSSTASSKSSSGSSSSSSSSSRASSSSRSKSSGSSSSESDESSSSSEDERRSKTRSHKKVEINAKTNVRQESNHSKEQQAVRDGEDNSHSKEEDKGKTLTSSGAKRSIKDRLGERQIDKDYSANRSSNRRENRVERDRNGGEREDRRLERRRNSVDAKNDHSAGADRRRKVLDRATRSDRSREGKSQDLRGSLRYRGRDMPKPHGHLRTSERSSDRREQNRHSLKDGDRRRRPDRKLEVTRGSYLREKADSYSKNPNISSLHRQHSRDGNVKSRDPHSQTGGKDLHSKNESDAESLSDIPLESEEENGDSDAEDVRFRKGRHENSVKKQETDNNSQSRIVMSLTLPTDSELQKADEEKRKDFKRRRTMGEIRDRSISRPSSRDMSRRDPRPEKNLSKSLEGRGTRPSNKNSRTLGQGRRRPRPSDFVSESESEDDKARSGLRSLVSGSSAAKKNGKDVSGSRNREGDRQKSRNNRGSPNVKDRGDGDRKRDRKERREKKSRRLVITEDEANQDQENGEDIVQKLSIRSRLGDRPTTTLRSSIKSRLGPKVSSPDDVLEYTELPEVQDRPKVRKIELSYENPDTCVENPDQISNLEGKASGEDAPVTKPNDLRHKMKRKLKQSSKKSEDDEHASGGETSGKRKVIKNNVWADIMKERSESGRGDAPSTVRQRSTERGKKADKEKRKEKSKTNEENFLEEKIKRMHEMNAAIMEKHKQIQKEKELFDC